jgi:hypothetical protein
MISYDKQLKYILLVCIAVGFYFQMLHLTTPLLDQYGFRQTQTAISSYWFLKEGFQWAYQTPVFGIPWSVPMEFPIYQYLVYVFVKIFNIENLDLAGRIVSLVFYYLFMYPLWQILRILKVNKVAIFYIFIVLVSSPIFIFWSRTFMIESTGLYFTLMFLMYLLRYDKLESSSLKILFLIFLFGTFAVLTKITTLLVGFIFIFLYLLFYGRIKALFTKKNLISIFVISIVVAIGLIWNEFANVIKSANPLSSFLTSSNLSAWNFGTILQRLDLVNYGRLLEHAIHNISCTLLLFFFVPSMLFCKVEYKKLILIGFLTFIGSFMILFNLYKVHNYYWYANSIFAIISLGLILYALSEKFKSSISKILLLLFIVSVNFLGYHNFYYKTQIEDLKLNRVVVIGDIVKEFTKTNDIIVTMGLDWDSSVPYYSQRKAIMIRSFSEAFKNVYEQTVQSNDIGAVIICDEQSQERNLMGIIDTKLFGFIETGNCKVYVRNISTIDLKMYLLNRNSLTQEEKVFFERKDILNSYKIELDKLEVTNAIRTSNSFVPQNNDMYISFLLPNECTNKDEIGLEINITRENNGLAQLFYRNNNEVFFEKNSIKKDFPDGNITFKFLIKGKNINYLRIDPTEKKETIQIDDIKIYCESKK